MITHSPTLSELAPALLAAQMELTNPAKDARGQVRGRTDYRYLSLAALIDATRPVLNAHGLAISQHPNGDGTVARVTTLLLHQSGEWIASDAACAVTDADPQRLGGIVSYLRRYAWQSVIGVCADDDDDAQTVAAHVQAQPRPHDETPHAVQRATQQARVSGDGVYVAGIKEGYKGTSKSGNTFTRYEIALSDGRVVRTVKRDHVKKASDAHKASAPVIVSVSSGQYGLDLTDIEAWPVNNTMPPADSYDEPSDDVPF